MASTPGLANAPPASVRGEVGERLWVLIVAGVPIGVVVAGVGSRLAMLVLRLTSPDTVVGATSDDGFEIGRFTLGGTKNLLGLGAMVGLFVALPALFGAVIAGSVDWVAALEAPKGGQGWILPAVLVAAFPLVIVVVGISAVVLTVWVPVRRELGPVTGLPWGAGLAVRGAWLSIALLGLAALVFDVRALA